MIAPVGACGPIGLSSPRRPGGPQVQGRRCPVHARPQTAYGKGRRPDFDVPSSSQASASSHRSPRRQPPTPWGHSAQLGSDQERECRFWGRCCRDPAVSWHRPARCRHGLVPSSQRSCLAGPSSRLTARLSQIAADPKRAFLLSLIRGCPSLGASLTFSTDLLPP